VTAGPASFQFSVPTRIRFGAGSRREVGAAAARYGRRAALVVGRAVADRPDGREVESLLAEAGINVVARSVAHGEPERDAVRALSDELRAARPDCVVAVGGGSTLDLAKAAALVPTTDRLEALFAGERAELPGIAVIALPTTAGSGAEVSHGAIVSDPASRRKRGIRGPGVAAREAIVDPELVAGAPAAVIAAAGFDAIAHAVETAASRASSALTLQLAATALPRLLEAVPRAHAEPRDLAAAGEAAYASMLMGINLANSSTCLPHRLQYPIGGLTGTSHAAGVAALFPAWLSRIVAVAPGSLARLARAARMSPEDASDGEAAERLSSEVLALLDRIGLRTSLGSLGIRADDVLDLVARVEGAVSNDPGPTAPDDLRDLYLASL
jgi:alcohol dehydrogenase class IV